MIQSLPLPKLIMVTAISLLQAYYWFPVVPITKLPIMIMTEFMLVEATKVVVNRTPQTRQNPSS